MIANKMIRFAAAVMSFCFAANMITASAEEVHDPPGGGYSVSIPFTVTDNKGWIPDGTVFTVTILTPNGSPLPEKTEYEVVVEGSDEFGPIIFDTPGDYDYFIKETVYDSDKIIFDETVYHVSVVVIWNEDGELTGGYAVTAEGSDEKSDELDFDNDYTYEPESGNSRTDSSESTEDSSEGPDDSSESPGDSSESGGDSSSQQDSSRTDDNSSRSDSGSSSRSSDGGGSSSGAPSWEPLLPPDTGGAVTFGISGAVLTGLALILISRRKQQDDEPPDERSG